ncbi:keywimysin-related RiPP [Streptomyces sp. NPDC003006]
MQYESTSTSTDKAVSHTTTAKQPYERPTLTEAGGFRKITGLVGNANPDLLGGQSLL